MSQDTRQSIGRRRGKCYCVETGGGLVLLVPFSVFQTVHPHFFVVLLEGGEILTSLGEFSLFHAWNQSITWVGMLLLTLSDVPVDEGALGIHEVEFVVQTGPSLGNGSCIGKHTDSTGHLGQVSSGHYLKRMLVREKQSKDRGRLVVDSDFKAGGAPIDELDRTLRLDAGNGSVDIFGHLNWGMNLSARRRLTTSPLKRRQTAMYLPWRGSHLTI